MTSERCCVKKSDLVAKKFKTQLNVNINFSLKNMEKTLCACIYYYVVELPNKIKLEYCKDRKIN